MSYGASGLTAAVPLTGGNVRKRVNEKGRCNLRFAKRTSGAINARTEGDTACGEEEHRVGRGVKPDLGDAGKASRGRACSSSCSGCWKKRWTACSGVRGMNGATVSMPFRATATASASHGG